MYFYVKGSAQEPYKITAEGDGSSFRVFCNCPAGRKGGRFCKHIAALLVGDVSAMVEGSDDVEALIASARLSGMIERAAAHKPEKKWGSEESDKIYAATGSIQDATAQLASALRNEGWTVAADKGYLAVHGFFKNGKPRKGPAAALMWMGDDREIDGAWMLGNKARPFYVGGSTFAHLSHAIDRFTQLVAQAKAGHLPG